MVMDHFEEFAVFPEQFHDTSEVVVLEGRAHRQDRGRTTLGSPRRRWTMSETNLDGDRVRGAITFGITDRAPRWRLARV
jgi:hypothetical protein